MSCRSTLGGRAASGAVTAMTGVSADEIPRVLHRLRREFSAAEPDAPRPTGEEAAQVIEQLAMAVRHRETGLVPEWRMNRIERKCAAAATAMRAGRQVPNAATLYAWRSLAHAVEYEAESERSPGRI